LTLKDIIAVFLPPVTTGKAKSQGILNGLAGMNWVFERTTEMQ